MLLTWKTEFNLMNSFIFLCSPFLLLVAGDMGLSNQQNPWLSQLTSAVNQWNFDQAPSSAPTDFGSPLVMDQQQEIRRSSLYPPPHESPHLIYERLLTSGLIKSPQFPPPSHYGHDLFVPTNYYPSVLSGDYYPKSDMMTEPTINSYYSFSNPRPSRPSLTSTSTSTTDNYYNSNKNNDGQVRVEEGRKNSGKSVDYYNNFYDFFNTGNNHPTPPPPIYYSDLNNQGNNYEYQKNTLMAMPVKESPDSGVKKPVPIYETSGWSMKPYRKPIIKINLAPVMNEFNSVCSSLFPQMEYGSFCSRKPRLGYPVDGA